MNTIELHRYGTKIPISISLGAIVSYEPVGDHTRVLVYGSGETSSTGSIIEVEENYEAIWEIISKEDFINEQNQLAFEVGVYQYIDFLRNEKSNPLRDEYLRWKGMDKLASKESESTAKVEQVDMPSEHNKVYKCMNCGQYMHRTAWANPIKYCSNCGSKLEWE